MLGVAIAYAGEHQYSEALEWYTAYLGKFPEDLSAAESVINLEARLADHQRLREVYDFADRCSLRFQLGDSALSDGLLLLYRSLGQGKFAEAEGCALQVQQQLRGAMVRRLQLGEAADLWAEAAHWASLQGFYDFAIDLPERSPRHDQEIRLYEAIQTASDLLELAEYFPKSREAASAERLRAAIRGRHLETINQAIQDCPDWDCDDDSDEGDRPGSGVPRSPRRPVLDSKAERGWGEWPTR